MIIVNGNEYRTLDQNFYVNGQKVIEAYANNSLVYPENKTGSMIKFRSKIQYHVEHVHHGEPASSKYTFHSGVKSFSLDLSAVQIWVCKKTLQDVISDEAVFGYEPSTLPIERSHNTHENVGPTEVLLGGIRYNTTEKSTYKITCDISGQQTNQPEIYSEKSRYTMSSIPICGYDYYSSIVGDHDDLSVDPLSDTIEWPCENNGIIQNTGVLCKKNTGTDYQFDDYIELSRQFDVASGRYEKNGLNLNANLHFLVNVIDRYNHREYTTTAGGQLYLSRLPITEILYVGDFYTAPEWAKNVYDSDLD